MIYKKILDEKAAGKLSLSACRQHASQTSMLNPFEESLYESLHCVRNPIPSPFLKIAEPAALPSTLELSPLREGPINDATAGAAQREVPFQNEEGNGTGRHTTVAVKSQPRASTPQAVKDDGGETPSRSSPRVAATTTSTVAAWGGGGGEPLGKPSRLLFQSQHLLGLSPDSVRLHRPHCVSSGAAGAVVAGNRGGWRRWPSRSVWLFFPKQPGQKLPTPTRDRREREKNGAPLHAPSFNATAIAIATASAHAGIPPDYHGDPNTHQTRRRHHAEKKEEAGAGQWPPSRSPPPPVSLCAACVAEGVSNPAASLDRRGRGQLCTGHVVALQKRNIVVAKWCLAKLEKEKPGPGQVFRLTSARPQNHKRLTFTSGDISVDLLRVHISPASSRDFPYASDLYLVYPKSLEHFETLANSRTFNRLSGLDPICLSFKLSCGRLSMYNFSGLAASREGATTTGLHRTSIATLTETKLSLSRRNSKVAFKLRSEILSSYLRVSMQAAAGMKEQEKLRIVHVQKADVWFQVPLNPEENRIFQRRLRRKRAMKTPQLRSGCSSCSNGQKRRRRIFSCENM